MNSLLQKSAGHAEFMWLYFFPGFLVLLGSLVSGTGPAQAAENEGDFDDFVDLDMADLLSADEYSTTGSFAGVVSSASLHEQDIGESPSAITVITQEQIENTHCLDLTCLLREVPEALVMEVRPIYSVVGARAMVEDAAARVLVLIDGQEVNNAIFGVVLWEALPIHIEDIERIEVIRGPGSALYGANAHSMVVSIFTRGRVEGTGQVFVAAGERERTSLHGRAGHAFEGFKFQLSGGLDAANSWEEPNRRERDTGHLRLSTEAKIGESVLLGRVNYSHGEGKINTFLGPTDLAGGHWGSLFLGLLSDPLQVKVVGNLFQAQLPFRPPTLFFENLLLGNLPDSIPFTFGDLELAPQLTLTPFQDNLLILGGSYRYTFGSSSTTEPSSMDQHGVGLFLHDEQKLFGLLSLVGSIRLDYNSLTPLSVSPRLATVFRFSPRQFARLSFGMAFRRPALLESSIHLSGVDPEPAFPELRGFFLENIGNEELDNERITSLEAGYHGRFLDQALVLEVDAFYNQVRDSITFHVDFVENSLGIPDLRRSTAQFRNNGREADSVGGMLAVTWRLGCVFRLHANYSYRYSYFTSDPAGMSAAVDGKKGDRVGWEPAHLAHLTAAYTPDAGLRGGLAGSFVSARDGIVSSGGALDSRMVVHEEATAFLSGFVSWRSVHPAGWMEVGLRVFDLLGTRFRDAPGTSRNPLGIQVGGEELDRRATLFLRGGF